MDDQRTEAAAPGQEAAPERRDRVFLLAEGAPLPDGVEEGDEGVFVIRVVPVTREDVEAENVAYLR
jgi:hypothetical protein